MGDCAGGKVCRLADRTSTSTRLLLPVVQAQSQLRKPVLPRNSRRLPSRAYPGPCRHRYYRRCVPVRCTHHHIHCRRRRRHHPFRLAWLLQWRRRDSFGWGRGERAFRRPSLVAAPACGCRRRRSHGGPENEGTGGQRPRSRNVFCVTSNEMGALPTRNEH